MKSQLKRRHLTVLRGAMLSTMLCGTILFADVKTPCGANVTTTPMQPGEIADWTPAQKAAIDALLGADFPNVVIQAGSATKTYNCHSYAWHNTNGAGGWMNDPGPYIDSYKPDAMNGHQLTYTQSLTHGPAHSAIDHDPLDYKATSKWGNLPVITHDWDDVLHGTKNGHGYAEYGAVVGIYSRGECCVPNTDCASQRTE